ncbi:DUF6404 family protein [Aeromonas lusitana]|uniref:Uncharacterized protein n=1 Tax=Aeromonas lusitana TaxID=931529 RepID=A0A2M8HAI8_9GAMM|nr:DUF6404 family protein [Aeromonas lusitana]PJC93587.1 hypothetical protein CUC44_08575 [Aeromonas lusitana]
MPFEQRLFAAHRELASKGVQELNYNPPLCRLLRKFGWQLKPPHYEHFMVNLISMGLSMGIIWGPLMWFFGWEHEVSLGYALRQISVFASCFGLLMAIVFWVRRRQLKLTPWEALPHSTPRTQQRWQPR